MRIIGGIAAGKRIEAPPGLSVRPALDKVKLAIFNSLGARCENARVLDLFAGSGALGLEALSRGANRLVSVESTSRHAQFFRRNLVETGLMASKVQLHVTDAYGELKRLAASGLQFDLILADPPYGEKNVGRRSTSHAQRLLDDTSLPLLLDAEGLFVLGHTKRDQLELPSHWMERRLLRHGDSVIRILSRGPSSS